MSHDESLESMGSTDPDALIAASRFSSPQELMRIASSRPDLRMLIAANPATPTEVLERLSHSSTTPVKALLAARGITAPEPAPQASTPGGGAPQPAHPWAQAPAGAQSLQAGSPTPEPGTGTGGMPDDGAGASMLSAPQPRHKRRTGLIAAVVAAVLVLGAAGGTAAWYFLWRTPALEFSPSQATLSDDWSKGAEQAWEVSGSPDATITATPDHVMAVTGDQLTVYSISSDSATQAWSTTMETAGAAQAPAVMQWGQWAVQGSTLYSLDSGEASQAPWGSITAGVAQDVAIACDHDSMCTAWDVRGEELWSATIPTAGGTAEQEYADSATKSTMDVITHGKERFIWLKNTVINLDTGQTMELAPQEGAESPRVVPAADGWLVIGADPVKDDDFIAAYDLEGKPVESYTGRQVVQGATSPALVVPRPLYTLQEYRTAATSDDNPLAMGTMTTEDSCLSEVAVTGRASIEPPSYGSTTDRLDNRCLVSASASEGAAVVTMRNQSLPPGGFQVMMSAESGQEVAFQGIDWRNDDSLMVASPTLVVGQRASDGALIGFRPAG